MLKRMLQLPLKFTLILIISALIGGCTLLTDAPPNTADDAQTDEVTIVITGAQSARDAATIFVRDHYGLFVPLGDDHWLEENITPEDIVGTSAYQFTSGNWAVSILFPVIAPESIIYTVLVTNDSIQFSWEGQIDAFGEVAETASSTSQGSGISDAPPTLTFPPTATSTPTPPGLVTFTDDSYRLAFDYPGSWSLIVVPAGRMNSSGAFAAKTIKLTKDGITLQIQYKFLWENTELGSNVLTGTLEVRGLISMLGHQIPKHVLVENGKDQVVFFGDNIDDITYHIRLETQGEELPLEAQALAEEIAASFVRTGDILSSPTPTLTPSITPTPSPTSKFESSRSGGSGSGVDENCNMAKFVAHVTVSEGASIPTGVQFTKTWRVENIGTCTWTTSYRLVYSDGDLMGADEDGVPLPEEVAPGETVDISIKFSTPDEPGEQDGYWIFQDNLGYWFGLGESKRGLLPVIINVIEYDDDFAYNFAYNYCDAVWKNKPQATDPEQAEHELPCPGASNSSSGFVILLVDPVMEHRQDDELTLWVHPNEERYGWIQGTYPKFTVQAGDHFKTAVGCMADMKGCSITFELHYRDSNGDLIQLGKWFEDYNESATYINIDLSGLAGQEVRFVLRVVAMTHNTDVAQGFWFVPRIER